MDGVCPIVPYLLFVTNYKVGQEKAAVFSVLLAKIKEYTPRSDPGWLVFGLLHCFLSQYLIGIRLWKLLFGR